VEVRDWPRPQLAGGEVEIAVAAAGICGADVSGFLGRSRKRTAPLILGHELVGTTADGRRVVVDPVMGCGRCAECRSGRKNLCRGLRLLGMDPLAGCFAEFVAVPAGQVHEIPDDLSDARAVFAEPLANIVHLFRLAAPRAGFRMGIVGAGTMGAMALKMALHLEAREVLVEDVDEARLAAARGMGAALAANAETEGGAAREFAGDGLDLVLEACGVGAARQEALDLCRPGGTVVLLGMAAGRSEVDFGASIRKEHRVLMSFGYTDADFKHSHGLLAAGAIDLTAWTAEMPLEEGQAAFERMANGRDYKSSGDTLKMVLRVR
jgi:threonine dehydrogenase-like Zn-dependent dehydrogenase